MSAKKIVVTVTENLLSQVDSIIDEEQKNRNELISEAIQYYIGERKRRSLRQELSQGYAEMAEINLYISCEYWEE